MSQREITGTQNMKTKNISIREIRSRGLARVNHIVRCHRSLNIFRTAFAQWRAGEIYVCRKTGDFRHRFGQQSRSITTWSAAAREAFGCAEAFAFAALVFAQDSPPAIIEKAAAPSAKGRINVLTYAQEVAA